MSVEEHDLDGVEDGEAHLYATARLSAAAVLSASYLHDMLAPHNLGFMGAAYTAAHESVELFLKLYLRRGPPALPDEESRGHHLPALFEKWGRDGRQRAEVAYQANVLGDLSLNRLSPARARLTAEGREDGLLARLRDKSATVGDVLECVDEVLGPENITQLCSAHKELIKGFACPPKVWYPPELLELPVQRYVRATEDKESLGLIEAFLAREGTHEVFMGLAVPSRAGAPARRTHLPRAASEDDPDRADVGRCRLERHSRAARRCFDRRPRAVVTRSFDLDARSALGALAAAVDRLQQDDTNQDLARDCACKAWHLCDHAYRALGPGSTFGKLSELQKHVRRECPELGYLQDICIESKHGEITRYAPQVEEARLHQGAFSSAFSRAFDISFLEVRPRDGVSLHFSDIASRAVGYWGAFFEDHEIG